MGEDDTIILLRLNEFLLTERTYDSMRNRQIKGSMNPISLQNMGANISWNSTQSSHNLIHFSNTPTMAVAVIRDILDVSILLTNERHITMAQPHLPSLSLFHHMYSAQIFDSGYGQSYSIFCRHRVHSFINCLTTNNLCKPLKSVFI